MLWGLYFWSRQRAGIMFYGAIRYPHVTYFGHTYLIIGGLDVSTKVCIFDFVARLE
jgi:hypothetical protein